MTASMQSPPAASTPAPISAAFRDCEATMPPLEVTAGLRICWELENWSVMSGLVVSCFLFRDCVSSALRRKPHRQFADRVHKVVRSYVDAAGIFDVGQPRQQLAIDFF